MTDGHLTLSIKNGQCHEVAELESDHEEADTRMLFQANHTGREARRIVIQFPDDVLLLCVTHCDEIGSELWFGRTGVKNHLRYIRPANKIAVALGPQMCKALPAFHSLTGCDSTSALSRMTKARI